jgi:hypothetical protein
VDIHQNDLQLLCLPLPQTSWWQKHNYYVLLSVVFDADTTFMCVLIFFALQNAGHNLKWWGTKLDHCPLATCPTAPWQIMVVGLVQYSSREA